MLISIAGVACVLAGRLLHPFLVPDDPAPGARLFIVEGWLDMMEVDQAIALVRQGRYERVVTMGRPVGRWSKSSASSAYADLAASYLWMHGLGGISVAAVPVSASTKETLNKPPQKTATD